jgi:Winged helix DNA-binding domain
MPSLTWEQISARRLARHGLTTQAPAERLADQVSVICGAHAQVMSAAEVSIALRVSGGTAADVRAALWEDRTLVKAFGPRGTVHVLRASDLPDWNAVLAAALTPPGFAPSVLLSAEQTDAVVAAVADAVSEADRTLEELDAEVVARAGAWAGERVMPAFQEYWPRWRQAMRVAAFRGALCFGPNRGARVTYTSPRRWLGAYRPTSADAATGRILRHYLHAYGPSSPAFFARWLNSTPAWARAAFRLLGDEVEPIEVEVVRLWQLADDRAASDGTPGATRLLPYFDAYVVGCQPREWLFPARAAERALTRSQAGNVPVLLIGDTVAGVWHQRKSAKRLAITVEGLRRLSAAERGRIGEEAERIGQIQAAAVTLTFGSVSAGPHA